MKTKKTFKDLAQGDIFKYKYNNDVMYAYIERLSGDILLVRDIVAESGEIYDDSFEIDIKALDSSKSIFKFIEFIHNVELPEVLLKKSHPELFV